MTDVCKNQDAFNKSFREAIKYVQKENEPRQWVQLVVAVFGIILIVWAVILAVRVHGSEQRIHIVLALLFSPVYIISYYLSKH